jgi:histidinol dehydrogenase
MDENERASAVERPRERAAPELVAAVARIVADVRNSGWQGLCAIARSIDGDEPRLVPVGPAAARARQSLSAEAVAAMELAARNIGLFHEASLPNDICIETSPGLTVRKLWRPIERVGLYVPGGKTPLFSTLMMLALPAGIARVSERVVVTPPREGGGLDPVMALAAELCGIRVIWTVGGAQAIAALAFGAGPIGKVDKICGPGNAWVAEAKRLVSSSPGGPAIDMPAGPSELMVVADEAGDADLITADLLAQAEHDRTAQVLLVTSSPELAAKVDRLLEVELDNLPRRAIVQDCLRHARLIVTNSLEQAAEIANRYAPEHLSIAAADPERMLPMIRSAGAVFLGSLAAETFADYLAGSSHVLPTDGAARAWSGVSVYTFLKSISVQSVTPEGARNISAPAGLLARLEALEAHARAADLRLERVR